MIPIAKLKSQRKVSSKLRVEEFKLYCIKKQRKSIKKDEQSLRYLLENFKSSNNHVIKISEEKK